MLLELEKLTKVIHSETWPATTTLCGGGGVNNG